MQSEWVFARKVIVLPSFLLCSVGWPAFSEPTARQAGSQAAFPLPAWLPACRPAKQFRGAGLAATADAAGGVAVDSPSCTRYKEARGREGGRGRQERERDIRAAKNGRDINYFHH